MSAAAADAAAPAPAAGGNKKKLIIIIVAAVLVLLLGGGGAYMALKPKPEAEEGAEADGHGGAAKGKSKAADAHAAPAPRAKTHDPKHPPVFVPLEPFTVNLADRDAERYAQIGVTLELDDAKLGDELKVYMPAIRNNILMVLSSKTSDKLLTREGKERLARQILYATVKPLGFPVVEDEEEDTDADEAEAHPPPKKKKKKRPPEMIYPITAVHFSTFIVQ